MYCIHMYSHYFLLLAVFSTGFRAVVGLGEQTFNELVIVLSATES